MVIHQRDRFARCAVRVITMAFGIAFVIAMAPIVLDAQAGRAAFEEGMRQLQLNEAGKAERAFEKAIAAEPKVAVYHLWLGRAVGVQAANASIVRQPFLARRTKAEFEKSVELDPTLLDAREHLIVFYLQAPGVMGGSEAKARDQAREIAKVDASRGHLAHASIAWHAKDTVATERAFRAAIVAAPDSAMPVVQLAQRLEAWSRAADAFALLDGFLVRRPGEIAATYRLARLSTNTGQQMARGEAAYRRLLAAPEWESSPGRPSKAAVHYRLGTLLEKNGRPAEARAAYRAALALDPNMKAAKDALDAVKG